MDKLLEGIERVEKQQEETDAVIRMLKDKLLEPEWPRRVVVIEQNMFSLKDRLEKVCKLMAAKHKSEASRLTPARFDAEIARMNERLDRLAGLPSDLSELEQECSVKLILKE